MRAAIILFIVLMPFVIAGEHHIKLLAVTEAGNESRGMTADLYLEVRRGRGQVFIDTFPLTKLDTQISTRFAKAVACSYLDNDCGSKDFFYTIRSNSVMVGGPSAAPALAFLTVASLNDYKIDESISVTGTVNAGGIIGPVGALEEKIGAAAEANITTVLIPFGERFVQRPDNTTVDLAEVAAAKGVRLREVATLDDVVYEYTGKRPEAVPEVVEDEQYRAIMRAISDELCNRTLELEATIVKNSTLLTEASELYGKAQSAVMQGNHYSAASFCFGANIKLLNAFFLDENMSEAEVRQMIVQYQRDIREMDGQVDERRLRSLNDLETYEIVKERLLEAADKLRQAGLADDRNDALYLLAYGIERYNSAVAWSAFFSAEGRAVNLNSQTIRSSCIQKLAEAEERYQYVQLYLPLRLQDTRKELDRAYEDLNSNRYQLCLFKATKAKADSDVVLAVLGLPGDKIPGYLDTKLSIVARQIALQQQKGNFPILGYSYYQYASSLKESDPYSALVYAGYALELSNLDMYFSRDRKPGLYISWQGLSLFMLGAACGVAIGLLFAAQMRRKCVHVRIKR